MEMAEPGMTELHGPLTSPVDDGSLLKAIDNVHRWSFAMRTVNRDL